MRKVSQRLAGEIDECRAESLKQPLVWRLTAGNEHRDDELSTAPKREGPPSATPSVSPVPTTEGITTYSQLMSEESEPITTAALRAELRSVRAELTECEANPPAKPSQHQRMTLSTPAPTPLTPIPSSAPSVSSAPTSEEWFQFSAAVADATNEEVIIEAYVAFPSQSPIIIDSSRSVSIVGRSAEDGGRVTLDGLGDSRLFEVYGGTLYLSHLNLVNGSAPEPYRACQSADGDYSCYGGFIIVFEDGQLVVSSCDIRGRGQHDVFDARSGGGVYVDAFRTTVGFYNVTFEALVAPYGAAFRGYKVVDDGIPSVFTFHHCQFLRNVAELQGVLRLNQYQMFVYLYACQFLTNEGSSAALIELQPPSLTEIRSCVFRGNMETSITEYNYARPALCCASGAAQHIRDCIFERNVGATGGALSVEAASRVTVTSSTFIENEADRAGAIIVKSGGSVTMINCYARANTYGQIYVVAATLVMLNSTVTESYAGIGGVGYFIDSAIVTIEHSVFTNNRAGFAPGFGVADKSSLSLTDCIHRGAECTGYISYLYVDSLSTIYAVRNVFQELLGPHIGPVYLRASTGYFEDCDFIDNYVRESHGSGGVAFLRPGSMLTISNSRISGTSAGSKGRVAWLDAGSSMRIVGSKITNVSGDAAFAIHNEEAGADFNIQLDTVVVDDTVNIFSNGSDVLLQNCDGFGSASVKKADIATCALTSDFCVPSSCTDVTAGTDCICTVDGVEVPFPTDCMQSAIMEARRLSIVD